MFACAKINHNSTVLKCVLSNPRQLLETMLFYSVSSYTSVTVMSTSHKSSHKYFISMLCTLLFCQVHKSCILPMYIYIEIQTIFCLFPFFWLVYVHWHSSGVVFPQGMSGSAYHNHDCSPCWNVKNIGASHLACLPANVLPIETLSQWPSSKFSCKCFPCGHVRSGTSYQQVAE